MTVQTVTHLNFRGNAREALGFYRSVFGGDQTIATYRDLGNVEDPSEADHVVWGQVVSDAGFRIMAYDVPSSRPWHPGENAFFVSLRGDSSAEITAHWATLSDGATVLQDLAPAAWSPLYGMLKDRFGVTWVLDVMAGHAPS